ncbi:hypothetical protein Naga_100317g3 [Nannochloropsis gaditana]|uniref:Beta-propeller repeat protein n=1 Tax=Nannochloropsis gaditana TaxID=72520 RepID=W7T3L8_9STRA|nr:hypothetical protein Naga_100317g3 [Nannochloropsis gaditana]
MRIFKIVSLFVLLGLSCIPSLAAEECANIRLTAKVRPTAKRGILAGNGHAKLTVILRNKDAVEGLNIKISLPSSLSVVRTTTRPRTPYVLPYAVENLEETAIYWSDIDFARRNRRKLFHVKVQADDCAPKQLEINALAYLANATTTHCTVPLSKPEVLNIRYAESKRTTTCVPTPAPSINLAEPFVPFGLGQRCAEASRLAPFGDRRLQEHLERGRLQDNTRVISARARHLQGIDTPQQCYEYCSLNGGAPAPFFFNWNTVASECLCCAGECTLIRDPAFDAFKVIVAHKNISGNPLLAESFYDGQESGATSICADDSGNSYITGYFFQKFSVGDVTLKGKGYADIFVYKINPRGGIMWARSFGAKNSAAGGSSIAVDTSGNSYVTGFFQGVMIVGVTILTPGSEQNVFVFKLDSGGQVVWAKNFGTIGIPYGQSIAVDLSGNSYTTGPFEETMPVGNTTLTAVGLQDFFVIKLDSTGSPVWAKSFGSNLDDMGLGITVDASDNSFITGFFSGNMSVGNTTLPIIGSQDIYMIKLNSTGEPVWAQNFGGTGEPQGNSIVVDASGNSYTTGFFYGLLNVGDIRFLSFSNAIFLIKLDSTGNPVWAKNFTSVGTAEGNGIAVDAFENSYITGEFNGNLSVGSFSLTAPERQAMCLLKLDPTGNPIWAQNYGGSVSSSGTGIDVDSSGNVYNAGSFEGDMEVGSATLTSPGVKSPYIIKLGP